jgi:hypothetical protein
MRTSRITLLCVASVLGAWMLVFVVPSLRYRSNITQEYCDRIEVGMTKAEVRNLLGGPPGNYTDRHFGNLRIRQKLIWEDEWIGDEGIIWITWTTGPPDQAWRVASKRFEPLRPLSFAHRCRRVFPWW